MGLQEKQQVVAELGEKFSSVNAAFLVDFQGCTCYELTDLRSKLRPIGAEFSVIKNNLARIAVQGGSYANLDEHLVGPTAIVWAREDIVIPAKLIRDFGKKKESFRIKAGLVSGQVVDGSQVEGLADLPSREELLGQLLALINAPATKLLQTINAPAASMVTLLDAWRRKREESGG